MSVFENLIHFFRFLAPFEELPFSPLDETTRNPGLFAGCFFSCHRKIKSIPREWRKSGDGGLFSFLHSPFEAFAMRLRFAPLFSAISHQNRRSTFLVVLAFALAIWAISDLWGFFPFFRQTPGWTIAKALAAGAFFGYACRRRKRTRPI